MKPTVTFRRDRKNLKKSIHLKNGVFLIYASKHLKLYPMQFERFDTKITVILPKNYCVSLKQTKLNKFVAIQNEFG